MSSHFFKIMSAPVFTRPTTFRRVGFFLPVALLSAAVAIICFWLSTRQPIRVFEATNFKSQPTVLWKNDAVSAGLIFDADPINFGLCQFFNVCLVADGPWSTKTLLPVSDPGSFEKLQNMLDVCANNTMRGICSCFLWQNKPVVVDKSVVRNMTTMYGHSWLLDTAVGHQIAHFIQGHAFFYSIYQHSNTFGLPSVDQIIFNQLRRGFVNEYEKFIHNTVMSSLNLSRKELLWRDNFVESNGICFEKMTTSGIARKIATLTEDAISFRDLVWKQLNLSVSQCPGSKTTILLRKDFRARRILNQGEIEHLLRKKYRISNLQINFINGANSTFEQSRLFHETGLMISSHSSQLINVIFSQPHSSFIEVSPAFFNDDFSAAGKLLHMHYQMVIGGQSSTIALNKTIQDFHQKLLKTCTDYQDSCIMAQLEDFKNSSTSINNGYSSYSKSVKNTDFYTKIDSIDKAIGAAIKHLHVICGGKWAGSSWK